MSSLIKRFVLSTLAVAFLAALSIAASAPAEARMGGFRMGGFHGGGFHRGFGGFHRGFGGGGFAVHRGFGGFRPVAFGHRPFFAHRFHHRRHFGGAFAAGLIGGAALGLASTAYAYPYPYYQTAAFGEECYVVRRARVNPWGVVVVRRILVCE